MTQKEREKLISELLAKCKKLRYTKGIEYSNSVDVNANFKSDLEIGVNEVQSCLVFANKHWRSIRHWARGGDTSEPIEGRITDLINYLLILYSFLKK